MLVRCLPSETPLHFDDTEDVFDVLLSITDGWSFSRTRDQEKPVLRISRCGGGFRIEEEDREAFCEDSAVSAACSLVAILLNRMVADDADSLCLHAGAVALGSQSLVFPSTHRAGKSTLVTALAFKGAVLVADDILPLDCSGPRINAVASGVAPRLRLPFAPSLGLRFRLSARRFAGPDDGYYRYIRLPPSRRCRFGAPHRPGAFIFLERANERCTARLFAVDKANAMRILLLQNFGTAAPSPVILDRVDRLAKDVPAFLLRYHELLAAVSLLEDSFGGAPRARLLWSGLEHVEPDLGAIGCATASPSDPLRFSDCVISQNPGVRLHEAEGSIFLADEEQGRIFALDPLGAAIWKFLAEPASGGEITRLICDAYPQIEPARIAADVGGLIETLLARDLVWQVH